MLARSRYATLAIGLGSAGLGVHLSLQQRYISRQDVLASDIDHFPDETLAVFFYIKRIAAMSKKSLNVLIHVIPATQLGLGHKLSQC